MAEKLKRKQPTRRDAVDTARLKLAGDPSHINAREDALLREMMPEAHGRVVTSGLLAEAGRRGDDRVTLLIPEEAALLKARGGSGTVNPASGLLEYSTAGGGGGEGGDNGVGGPGNGSAGTGPGQGEAGTAGVGGNTSFSDNYGIGWGGPESSIGGYGGSTSFSDNYDVGWGVPESEIGFSAQQPNWNEYAFNGYKPAGTWGRFFQELVSPSVPNSKYGMTTGTNLGIMGTAVGKLAGGPMSSLMGIGEAMGRASTPAEQAANAAAESARSGHNSTGQDRDSSTGLSFAELDARNVPGAASGSNTAGLLAQQTGATGTTAPGATPTVQPGGLMTTDERERTLTGLPAPVQNLLADYIWRGRQGTGFGW